MLNIAKLYSRGQGYLVHNIQDLFTWTFPAYYGCLTHRAWAYLYLRDSCFTVKFVTNNSLYFHSSEKMIQRTEFAGMHWAEKMFSIPYKGTFIHKGCHAKRRVGHLTKIKNYLETCVKNRDKVGSIFLKWETFERHPLWWWNFETFTLQNGLCSTKH